MDNKWIWIGFGALVLVFILARQRASAQVIGGGSDVDVADMERSRFDFAARGLDSLTSFLSVRGEHERDLALGQMAFERDVTLGRYSVERDLGVAAAQERAATAAADSYYKSAVLAAANDRYAQQQTTKRSWLDGLLDFGADVLGTIFGGNNDRPSFGPTGSPPFNPNAPRLPAIGPQPSFGR